MTLTALCLAAPAAAGAAPGDCETARCFTAMRLNPDGSPDASFGAGGVVRVPFHLKAAGATGSCPSVRAGSPAPTRSRRPPAGGSRSPAAR